MCVRQTILAPFFDNLSTPLPSSSTFITNNFNLSLLLLLLLLWMASSHFVSLKPNHVLFYALTKIPIFPSIQFSVFRTEECCAKMMCRHFWSNHFSAQPNRSWKVNCFFFPATFERIRFRIVSNAKKFQFNNSLSAIFSSLERQSRHTRRSPNRIIRMPLQCIFYLETKWKGLKIRKKKNTTDFPFRDLEKLRKFWQFRNSKSKPNDIMKLKCAL